MNSIFNFPRRVRIHGGECGAVARALHHEAQEDALMSHERASLVPAAIKKALIATNERKQMSTKTTLKRIALVAVSALGFGLMTVMPAKAAVTNTLGNPTANAAVEDTELTVSASLGFAAGVLANETASVSATLVTKPAASSNSALVAVVGGATATPAGNTGGTITGTQNSSNTNTGIWTYTGTTSTLAFSVTQTWTITPDTAGTYMFAVFVDTDGDGVLDSGETVKYLSVTVATTPAASVVLDQPLAGTGSLYSATESADGLVVRVGLKNSAGTLTRLAGSQQVIITVPSALTIREKNGNGTALTVSDTDYSLVAGDFNASGYAFLNVTASAAGSYELKAKIGGSDVVTNMSLSYAARTALATACAATNYNANGTDATGTPELVVTTGYMSSATAATVSSAATSTTFRVCADSADTSKLVSVEVTDTDNRIWASPADLIQDMVVTLGSSAGSSSATNGSASKAHATFAVTHSALSKNASGSYRSFTAATVNTASTAPTDLLVTATGDLAAIDATGAYQTAKPASTLQVVNGGSVTLTVTFSDQFGGARVGEAVSVEVAGRNESAAATNLVTDATGTVSFTLTDAAPTSTDSSDVVTFTGGTATEDITINYKAAIAATTMTMSPVTTSTSPSSSAVYTATATSSLGAVTVTATVKDANAVAIAGLPVTLTYPADLTLSSTSTATAYSSSTGVASWGLYTTKAGTYKVTATGGGLTKDVYLQFTGGAARVVSVTPGTSAGDVTPVVIKVADAYGNGVSGVAVTITGSGAGYFQGIPLGSSQNTTSNGTVSAAWIGSGTITATITGGQSADEAGFVGTTATAGFPAGVGSASATVTGGANASADAANAAADAAAEAIDAANAATDAANLAAEAADAATVAAEEARDAADAATAAVEELATQVATLMAALKAQITTLANTVAKIAKKVKA